MASLSDRLAELPSLLAERAERYGVPGASVAVLAGGETFEAATGVVNVDTGVAATPDAVFQIGSITKVFTTTLVMQLVDEGRVELDAPVRDLLPELELADSRAAKTITTRQLLTHTSGIDGDHFVDTGRGADCVERFVVACAALPQLHAPGEGFSYCNAGFVIAGRIVEKLRAETFGRALERYLLDPIGARSLHTDPEYALYHRAAIGHMPAGEGSERTNRPVPFPTLAPSNVPAGATPFGAARDLLALARLHLSGGVADGGDRVLSERSVAAMQQKQVDVPPGSMATAWGLGWMLFDWDGRRLIGHDGGTIGQASSLRVVPDAGVAVALLMNGGNTAALRRRVLDAVLGELVGVQHPPLLQPAPIDLDPSRYCGTYERLAARYTVLARDGRLFLRTTPLHFPVPSEEDEVELRPVSDSVFEWSPVGSRMRNMASFLPVASRGPAAFFHIGARSAPRVG